MKQNLLLKGLMLASFFLTNVLFAQSVFINEIHYDNVSTDVGEAIEIAGPAGTDLTGWSIVLYNGGNSSPYDTDVLSGVITDQQNGFGTVVVNYPSNGIQNGAPDGIALVNAEGEVIQFLSYEGVITAANGPASGQTSTDIGVSQDGTEAAGVSLQLGEEGQSYQSFTWQTSLESTFGTVNANQSFGGETTNPEPEPEPEPELPPAPAVDVVFINEIHYDNNSTDSNEGVEIAGTSGTDLSGYQILLYNGSASQLKLYNPSTTLSGIIPEQQNGYGTIFFPIANIQNGDPDGIALIDPDGNVLQFLSYGGAFVPTDGPAAGMESTDIGVKESGNTPVGYSLQLTGEGSYYDDFTWAGEAQNTFGNVNTIQTFLSPEPVLFINEFHYDTAGTDAGEGIEVAGTAGLDLAGYSLVLYNGSNGAAYNTRELAGVIPNQDNGFGTLNFMYPSNGIQNGSPDGFALVKGDEVIQFLSYEGTLVAVGGPADGLTSTDVGVTENNNTTVAGSSLQLGGTGFKIEDFTWQESLSNTFGAVNINQSFGGPVVEPEPEPEVPAEPGTIAFARAAELGTKLEIEGTLTVSDHFGNVAYIQDETGGIAIFGNLVTEAGLFQVGDSLRVTGTRAVFTGLIQISDVESVEYLGAANEPIQPKEISISEMEKYRGQLVKIKDVSFPEPGALIFGNSNIQVTDGGGMTGELRIDSDVKSLVGKTQPEICAEVIGVVGRYNNTNQLLPREFSDLPCAQIFNPIYPGSDISKELTFEAVTWNIEWFGDEKMAPSAGNDNSDEIQKEAVKSLLLKLDADLIAVNEISDDTLFAEMIGEMEGYNFILSDATSYPNDPGGQKVGFIFKTKSVEVTDTRAMFTSVHPFYEGDGSLLKDYPEAADRFYASGRLPFLMEANVTIAGETQEMKFIALHARANSGSGAQSRYDMRKYDVEVLKDSLDMYYPNDKVMILGDYNDDVDVTVANVSTTVSTYERFINDTENYFLPTTTLSEQNFRSYLIDPYDDMIDHIMITNELVDNYITGSARVHYELYTGDFTFTTSDHLPVSVRLIIGELKVASIESTGVLCSETDTATATVYAEGGIAPYNYSWSNGQVTQTATDLSAGTYSVTVTDYLDNSVVAEIVIEEAKPIVLTMIDDQTVYVGYNTSCTTLGVASVSGGSGDYTYLWSTGETSETISVCPSEDTTYTLEITDVNGCSISSEVNVDVINISCGKIINEKVQLCYKGKSMCVAKPAVESLLKNGAKLGSCDENNGVLTLEEIVASPNPTSGSSVVRVTSSFKGNAILSVYDISGNTVQSQKVSIAEGTSNFQVDLGRAIPGIYIIKIKGINFESDSVKIIRN